MSQVEIALNADPSSAELQSLQSELKELIDLTRQAIAASTPPTAAAAGPSKPAGRSTLSPPPRHPGSQAEGSASPAQATPPPPAATAAPAVDYKVGDQVLAKYTDNRFYPAKILAVSGPAANQLVSVTFVDYASSPPSTIPISSLKPLPESLKRKAEKSVEEREKEKKKAKNERWKEIKEGKNQVQVAKQQGWQSFAKKATKKGLSGVKQDSMFKTPDAVDGKGQSPFPPLLSFVFHSSPSQTLTLGLPSRSLLLFSRRCWIWSRNDGLRLAQEAQVHPWRGRVEAPH